MIEPPAETAPCIGNEQEKAASESLPASVNTKKKKSKSMHDGIAVWCDCCSCEAEPYWVAVAEEMGIDLGSDYEDEVTGQAKNK